MGHREIVPRNCFAFDTRVPEKVHRRPNRKERTVVGSVGSFGETRAVDLRRGACASLEAREPASTELLNRPAFGLSELAANLETLRLKFVEKKDTFFTQSW